MLPKAYISLSLSLSLSLCVAIAIFSFNVSESHWTHSGVGREREKAETEIRHSVKEKRQSAAHRFLIKRWREEEESEMKEDERIESGDFVVVTVATSLSASLMKICPHNI